MAEHIINKGLLAADIDELARLVSRHTREIPVTWLAK